MKSVLLTTIILASIAMWSISLAGKPLVFRTAETHPVDYPTAQAVHFFGERLNKLSNGSLAIKLYAGGQLGSERDTIEITLFGGIDINRINMAPLNAVIPETSMLGLPFLFRSTEHLRAVLDSDIGDEILASLEPHGLIGLAFYDSGARSFYNNKHPVNSPDDLKGLKIRVQNSELAIAMVKALGGNPTPMGFGQVYESLLLGTIDGSENNWPSYQSTGHVEAAQYYTLTKHTMMPEVLVMSKVRWNKLTKEQQVAIRRAAKESVLVMRQLWDQRVIESREKALSAGAEVVESLDLTPFADAMQPLYDTFVTTDNMRTLLTRIQNKQASP